MDPRKALIESKEFKIILEEKKEKDKLKTSYKFWRL